VSQPVGREGIRRERSKERLVREVLVVKLSFSLFLGEFDKEKQNTAGFQTTDTEYC